MKTNNLRFVEEIRSVVERKKSLRSTMKERRGLTENRDVKELLLLENFKKLLEETPLKDCKSFFVYLSFSSEAPTDKLIEYLIGAGKEVYCPRIEEKDMYAVRYGEDFSLSNYGIREPIGERFEGNLDVLLMPLLAVDLQGNRLGYGGGFYDKFIQERKYSKRIAYCYDFQIISEVPAENNDKKVEYIVTDKQVVAITKYLQ